eukprot:gene4522-5538_t
MDHICADVDECAEGRLGSMACAPQSHCINLPGGSSCGPCDPPDLYRGDGYECRLVQTCSEENGGCDLLTTCVSLEQGGVQCGGCPLGMSGSGDTRCVDVDGCREAPCFPGVECSDILPPEFGAPLVLAVRGGQLVTGESSPIVLEADSIDPDGEPGEINFVWRCYLADVSDGACRHANGTRLPAEMTGAEITVMLQGATPMQNYTFVVTGSKDSRVTEATTWLRIYPGSPPVPVIAPLLERVNPNSKLRLFGSARAMFPQDLTYEWTARSLGESAAPLNLTSRKVLASSSRFIPSIVLHEGVLVGGSEYVFQLATRDRQGVGTVQMAVQVNAPPQYGWVEIAPSVGLAYMDTFVLTAPGWVDEDSPMWFQYSCQAVGGETLMLNDFAPLARPVSTLSTVLPLEGLEAFAYQVTGRVTARDSLGATSEAERNITVTSPLGSDSGITSADLIQTLTGGIDESLGSGDSGLAMVLVDSVASILNSSSRSNESAALVAVQGDMLAHVAQVKEGAFPATSSVERFARSVSALSSDVQKLSDDAQLQSLGLLRGLVQDTQS